MFVCFPARVLALILALGMPSSSRKRGRSLPRARDLMYCNLDIFVLPMSPFPLLVCFFLRAYEEHICCKPVFVLQYQYPCSFYLSCFVFLLLLALLFIVCMLLLDVLYCMCCLAKLDSFFRLHQAIIAIIMMCCSTPFSKATS